MIVCWEDNLSIDAKKKLAGIEIIELKTFIEEIDNTPIQKPDKIIEKSEYDIHHHFNRKKANKNIQQLYYKLETGILNINEEIFRKFAKTVITYYSPEKTFVYTKFRKSCIVLHIYTNQQKIKGVKLVSDHENWGEIKIENESDLQVALSAIKKSYKLMRNSIRDNINTGWFAITPREKINSAKEDKNDDDENE